MLDFKEELLEIQDLELKERQRVEADKQPKKGR